MGATRTIWKVPSASGLKCMSATGSMTMMGQLVATRTENCPCPTCDTPPDGSLVANILDNGTYLSAGYTPVSVGGSLAVKCGVGYTSNGSTFSCVYSTPYAGVYGTPYPTCDPLITTTTTTTTAAPTTAAPSTTPYTGAPTTTHIINVTTYTLKASLTLDIELPPNTTAAALAADTTFVSNVADSIATGLGVDKSKVTITGIKLARRLQVDDVRRLQAPKLKVEYELVTTSLAEATAVQETLADPTKAASFTAAFSTALVEKEAASGRTIVVKEIVAAPATVTSKTVAVVIAPTPAPPPAPSAPTPTPPTPTPTPPTPPPPSPTPPATPAPTPTPATVEEEDPTPGPLIGGIVGGIVGIALLGGLFYMYKKKSGQE